MSSYIALLRGINVGGNSLIKMSELKEALSAAEIKDVKTYIQSGNVIFSSEKNDVAQLARDIEAVIEESFSLPVRVVVFSHDLWRKIIENAPEWWGKDTAFKHNLLVMLEPCDTRRVVKEMGTLKPDFEKVAAGEQVVYQALSWQFFGRATSGKLASMPIYKQMTVRTFNTAAKILQLLNEHEKPSNR